MIKSLLNHEQLISNAQGAKLPPVFKSETDVDDGCPVIKLPLIFEALQSLERLTLLWCWYCLLVRTLGWMLQALVQKSWWRDPITVALWADIFRHSVYKFIRKGHRTQYQNINFLQRYTWTHKSKQSWAHCLKIILQSYTSSRYASIFTPYQLRTLDNM